MNTENLSTLKIHKLTQEQYDRELSAGRIDENALYLTPDVEVDLSGLATLEDLVNKADKVHNHDDLYYTEYEVDSKISDINTSIGKITSGTTTVKKAEHSTSADSATSSLDAEKLGGQLPSFYAKASDIPTGALADKDIVSESDLDSALVAKVNAAAQGNHSHSNKSVLDGITSTKVSNWDNAEANAKTYADQKVANLLDNSTEAVDSIMELAEAMKDNADAIEALEGIAATKVPTTTKVNGKALSSDITLSASDVGADASGSASAVQKNLDSHIADTVKHITSTERTNWGTAYAHSQAAHAPSNAQANVIESIKVNGTAQTITSKAVNITVPTDNSQLANGAGYITSSAIANKADKSTTLAGYGITDAYTKTQVDSALSGKSNTGHGHDVATTSANGFMSTTMVTKLSGIAEGANKTVVDSTLSSSSTNPVQNKVINSAIATATQAITTNTNTISTHTSQISTLQSAINDIHEITSEEIQNLFK